MNLSFFDLALLGGLAPARILDSFESYSTQDPLALWNGGTRWAGAWVSRPNIVGIQTIDAFESYQVGLSVAASPCGGAGWPSAFVYGDAWAGVRLQDTLETYNTGDNPNGLAGGSGLLGWTWAGAWVSR